jgi:hypothetical protein
MNINKKKRKSIKRRKTIRKRKTIIKGKQKRTIKGGKRRKPKNHGKLLKERITQDTYHQYLNLGKTQQPVFKKMNFNIQTNPDILNISRNALKQTINNSTYSLLPYYFIPDIPVESHDDHVEQFNSGNCVFFAKKILNILKQYDIEGYLIPATTLKTLMQPGFPEFCHCVVLVRDSDNFIIYEPAFYLIEPIIVKIDGTPTKQFIQVYQKYWSYRYDSRENKIFVEDETGQPLLYYYLVNIENPSTAISYPVNINNRRIPIVKYNTNNNKKEAHLSIRLDTNFLEGYNTQNNSDDGWFPRLNYKEILDLPITESDKKERISSWDGLSTEQCNSFNCDKDDLINKIYLIIDYHNRV